MEEREIVFRDRGFTLLKQGVNEKTLLAWLRHGRSGRIGGEEAGEGFGKVGQVATANLGQTDPLSGKQKF
jgi:hypothetical protein